jgi:hypothetical protein
MRRAREDDRDDYEAPRYGPKTARVDHFNEEAEIDRQLPVEEMDDILEQVYEEQIAPFDNMMDIWHEEQEQAWWEYEALMEKYMADSYYDLLNDVLSDEEMEDVWQQLSDQVFPRPDDMLDIWYAEEAHITYLLNLAHWGTNWIGNSARMLEEVTTAYDSAALLQRVFRDPTEWNLSAAGSNIMQDMHHVALALKVSTSRVLRHVRLSGLGWPHMSALLPLGKGLALCPQLDSLCLANMSLGDDGVRDLLAGLGGHPTLRDLDLFWTGMGGTGTQYLAYWLQRPDVHLQTLDISHNDIEQYGSTAMGAMLRNNTSLRTLWMKRCSHVTDHVNVNVHLATRSFLRGLRDNRHLQVINVDSEHTQNCIVSARNLVKAVRNHPALTDLRMAGAMWDTAAVTWLSQMVASPDCRLRKLDISTCHLMGAEEWALLGTGLAANKSLRYLWMDSKFARRAPMDERMLFIQLVQTNCTLRHFLDDVTFANCRGLAEWKHRMRIMPLRDAVCRRAAVAMLGIKKFHCPPWMRAYGRDMFMLLARAIMETRHDDGWGLLNWEPPVVAMMPRQLMDIHLFNAMAPGPLHRL